MLSTSQSDAGLLVFRVGLDDLAQIHGVGAAVDDMVAGEGGAGLAGQGVNDAGVRAELGGHGAGELRIDDGDIGGDVEIGQRVLDAILILGDDEKAVTSVAIRRRSRSWRAPCPTVRGRADHLGYRRLRVLVT